MTAAVHAHRVTPHDHDRQHAVRDRIETHQRHLAHAGVPVRIAVQHVRDADAREDEDAEHDQRNRPHPAPEPTSREHDQQRRDEIENFLDRKAPRFRIERRVRPREVLPEQHVAPCVRPRAGRIAFEHEVQHEEQVIVRQRAQPAADPELAHVEIAALGFGREDAADQESAEHEEELDAELARQPPRIEHREIVHDRHEEEARVREEDHRDRERTDQVEAEDVAAGHRFDRSVMCWIRARVSCRNLSRTSRRAPSPACGRGLG